MAKNNGSKVRRHAWQIEAMNLLQEKIATRSRDALIVASVGGGKTLLACDFADQLRVTTAITRIIVVAPSRRLVKQWARELNAAGISMTEVRSNRILRDGLPLDVSGYIMTYAGMARWPDLHEAYAHEKPTLVIFDEIHHLGEEDHTSWGPAAQSAFRSVTFRLALSGTPFRSSERPIPFVRYLPVNGSNDTAKLDPDYNYSHGQAVADGVCRRTRFPPYDGSIEFSVNDKVYTNRFDDDLPPDLWSARLYAACQPRARDGKRNRLLEKMLFEANQRLTDIRNAGHPDAAGIIIANDIAHASRLKKFLEETTGEVAVLVATKEGEDGEADDISDEAQERLDAFSKGESRWLIAVRMVTEGVDIPRLRVGVYLAQVTEELFFIQFLGRIVRKGRGAGGDNGESFLFMFADSRLMAIAKRIEDDIERRIREKRGGTGGNPGERRDYGLIDADGDEQDTVVAGESFTPDEMSAADELRGRYPQLAQSGMNIVDLARLAREFRGHRRGQRGPAERSYDEERKDIADEVNRKTNIYCNRSGTPFERVNGYLNEHAGLSKGQKRPQASIDQLKHMNRLIDELIAKFNGGEHAA